MLGGAIVFLWRRVDRLETELREIDWRHVTLAARIASFMALGFSLIGIGWFYTRQLKAPGARGA